MAGRGTDIQLGGNLEMRSAKELGTMVVEDVDPVKLAEIKADIEANRQIVLDAGGLFVLCTERHESRRIDNQLRGRAGRQGDPGASKFFVSLEDDLMRIFGSERMDGMLRKLGLEEGEAIIHPWINKALEKAQQKVEERNFEIRKQLLRFDDVMNDQRKVIYVQRKELMRSDDVSNTILDMRHDLIEDLVAQHIPENAMPEQWTMEALEEDCQRLFGMDLPVREWAAEEGIADQEICERISDALDTKMAEKTANYGPETMRMAEKSLLLQILDQNWKDHLLQLDHLRQGIGLRAYGQRDPLNEYKKEAFELFEELLGRIRESVTAVLAQIEVQTETPKVEIQSPSTPSMIENRDEQYLPTGTDEIAMEANVSTVRSRQSASMIDPEDPSSWGKVPRNSPCPCGSGKKYKQCHGKL
jgi:preprotein translocase subunit SecA